MNKLLFYLTTITFSAALMMLSCKKPVPPAGLTNKISITIDSITGLTTNEAKVTSSINRLSGRQIAQHGHCWDTIPDPAISGNKVELGPLTNAGSFTGTLAGLLPNTGYYVRAYVMFDHTVIYSEQDSFFTANVQLPVITTTVVDNITPNSATSGGNITSDGGAPVTARGVCWSTNQNPTIADNTTNDGSGTGSFTSGITGLSPGQTYYVRAYATNSAGTGYGDEKSFTTLFCPSTVTGNDGNVYQVVRIGNQCWMAENLRTTRYANGDAIPQVTGNSTWSSLSTGAWCWYDNDNQYENPYGKLYNWHAVADSRNICPAGWHVPTDAEWDALANFLGGSNVAGGKMKATGTAHWNSPNTDATNSSGFTGLPGGYRYYYGYFYSVGAAVTGGVLHRTIPTVPGTAT